MAKWNIEDNHKADRHIRTGGIYYVIYDGLEVTGDEAIPSIVYQSEDSRVFAKFEDGRFEEVDSSIYTHGFSVPGDVEYEV